MTTQAPTKHLSVDEALDLADDLLRQLAEHLGDIEALNEVFRRWDDVLAGQRLSLVCMAALQTTFADCLTIAPLDEIPAGAHVYVTPAPEEKP